MANVNKSKQKVTTAAQEPQKSQSKSVVVVDHKLQLENYTTILRGCADNIRSNYVTIGTYLLKIKEEKLIVTTDGWQNFVNETLDMSVPTAYRIMSTVEKFYNPKALETDSDVISKLDGFKDSTISRLLPLGDYDTIKTAILDGTFTAEMSAREVTDKVADILEKKNKKSKGNKKDGKDSGNVSEKDGKDSGNVNGNGNVDRRENPITGEITNYDKEVFLLIHAMIDATSLVEVQNLGKTFLNRWFE